jgi:hypothetical protein
VAVVSGAPMDGGRVGAAMAGTIPTERFPTVAVRERSCSVLLTAGAPLW